MKHRDLDDGDPFPASLLDALQEHVGTLTSNFRPVVIGGTQIQVAGGAGAAQVAVGFGSAWRFNAANASTTHPGGAAGIYELHAVASANDFDPIDETDYTFGLKIVAAAGTPTGTHNTKPIALNRKMYEVQWDGAAITELRSMLGQTDRTVGPWVTLMRSRQTWQASYGATVRWPDGLGGGGIVASGGSWTAAQPPPEFWAYNAADEIPGRSFEYRFSARVLSNTGSNITGNIGMVKMPALPAVTTAAAILAPNLNTLMPMPYASPSVMIPATNATVVKYDSPPFTVSTGGGMTDGSVWTLAHNFADVTANNFHFFDMALQRRLV